MVIRKHQAPFERETPLYRPERVSPSPTVASETHCPDGGAREHRSNLSPMLTAADGADRRPCLATDGVVQRMEDRVRPHRSPAPEQEPGSACFGVGSATQR